MASRYGRRKLFSCNQVLDMLNESSESDVIYSSEDEYKVTKSDLEAESSRDEEPSPKQPRKQTPKKKRLNTRRNVPVDQGDGEPPVFHQDDGQGNMQAQDNNPVISQAEHHVDEPPDITQDEHHADEPPDITQDEHRPDEPPVVSQAEHHADEPPDITQDEHRPDEPPVVSQAEHHADEPPDITQDEHHADEPPDITQDDHHADEPPDITQDEHRPDEPPVVSQDKHRPDEPPVIGQDDSQGSTQARDEQDGTPMDIDAPSNRCGRKRSCNEENWKANIRKRARNQDKEYTSRSGKVVQARKTMYHRCGRCVNKCNEVLPDAERDVIFQNYWKLGDSKRQRDFIASHVRVKQKTKRTPGSNRKCTLYYYFTTRKEQVKVCKAVFLTTLGIGEKTVTYTIDHMLSTGQSVEHGRINVPPAIKKPDEVHDAVMAHISSFPAVESHYCRKNTTRKYLSKDLNIRKMHSLYQQLYQAEPLKLVKESYYRSVFNSREFNHLSFHKPKKDLCCFCVTYENGTQEQKEERRGEYEVHIARRDRVFELKQELKNLAKANDDVVTASFDLEQVLLCPRINVSSLFYRRKLATYNLTVYDMGTRDVSCYMWHEGAGGRRCNKIATSVHLFLKSLSPNIKHVILFSDTCSAQNRNQFFSAMCLNAVREMSIKCVDQIYMESGHSHMECDTAHSTIETALKNQDVYCPADYFRIVAMAQQKHPFKVVVLDTEEFLDFKDLNKKTIRNKKKDIAGNTVQWLKIKWIRYCKDTPYSIFFKYSYDEEFMEMRVNHGVRGRPSNAELEVLVPLFNEPPSILQAKYDDLLFLCDSLAIPRFYHDFFKGLKSSGNVRDALPEPDVTEEDPDEAGQEH